MPLCPSAHLGDWFHGPKEIGVYQERGETFIRHFFNGEIEPAHAVCDPELQNVIS